MVSIVIRPLLISAVAILSACGSGSGSESVSNPPTKQVLTAQPAHPYTTTFPRRENPISEGSVWINGRAIGLDWSDVETTPGLAYGKQPGVMSPPYNDSIAIVAGAWEPDQTVSATVHTVNQQGRKVYEEVEILLRFEITAHTARGYEVNFRCTRDGSQYTQVVRWNGPVNDFTQLDERKGPGIKDGDTVKATIVGNVITVYINNKAIFHVTDNRFARGNPGLGFFLHGAQGVNSDYGFTSYTASDGSK